MTKWILGLAVAVSLAIAPVAEAHITIIEPVGSWRPYQQWADESRVPTPPITVIVEQVQNVAELCESQDADGCIIYSATPEIVLGSSLDSESELREVFFHEIGHAWDRYAMQDWQRERFEAIVEREVPWEYGAHYEGFEVGTGAPIELFAESYSLCARLDKIDPSNPYLMSHAVHYISGADLRSVCRMIGRTEFSVQALSRANR